MAALSSLGSLFKGLSERNARSALILIGALIALIGFGRLFLDLDQEAIIGFFNGLKASPWSFLGVLLVFVSLAMVGFPQALLFAGTVAVFGPWWGMLYAWCATIVSASITYALGRTFGEPWVKKISGDRAQTMIRVMQNRGLLASMIVRWTPSAPFIVVNSVCGAAGMPIWKFLVGTGLGIIPKLALIAVFTEQLDDLGRFLTRGDTSAMVALIGLAAAWIVFFLFCRWLYKRLRTTSLAGLAPQTEISQKNTAFGADEQADLNLKSKAG
ncbi:MAG: VTT domain-containing protein [Pseudomonadota bacterium]